MTTVVIIRHAEKVTWPGGLQPTNEIIANYIDNHVLSTKGQERAHALVPYFTQRDDLKEIFRRRPLAALICQDADRSGGPGKSIRCKETLIPLSKQLNDILLECYVKSDIKKVIDHIKACRIINFRKIFTVNQL